MPKHPDTTVRVPHGERDPVISYQAPSAYDVECCVNWDDGSVWFLGWLDCGGIFAQRWYEPDDGDEVAFSPWRDCPGPDLGAFASVDALEAATDELEAGFGIGQISVASSLGWLDFRFSDLDWRNQRPGLADWFEEISDRPSMTQTVPKEG